jgi:hypothetical protein
MNNESPRSSRIQRRPSLGGSMGSSSPAPISRVTRTQRCQRT